VALASSTEWIVADVTSRVKGWTIVVHRWLGVGLCLVFLLWFASAIGIAYWDYPAVNAADRLDHSPPLDATTIVVSPEEALQTAGLSSLPRDMRLSSFDGRPAYRIRLGGDERIVYADRANEPVRVTPDVIRRTAAAWTGRPASTARVDRLVEPDQWTLEGAARAGWPLWKYSWPTGEEVYVSEATGEVVQYTTTAARIHAYLGAIPHWLYFPPLRRRVALWKSVIVVTAGIGTFSAILGLIIGVWMLSPSKRYRRGGVPAALPYRGQKRWHAILGLTVGMAAVTWAFSGMLSVDPFSLNARQDSRRGHADVTAALRGRVDPDAFRPTPPRQALTELSGLEVKELELAMVGGEPVYVATLRGNATRVVPVAGAPRPGFERDTLMGLISAAVPRPLLAGVSVLDHYDVYYLDRAQILPIPVLLVRLNDIDHTRYYVDLATARILRTYSARGWVNRWLYHALHSLDFPWLYAHRPLWDIVVVGSMLAGTALCITSIVLAWRVMGRQLRRALRVPAPDVTIIDEITPVQTVA
jgi:hypothetical protein